MAARFEQDALEVDGGAVHRTDKRPRRPGLGLRIAGDRESRVAGVAPRHGRGGVTVARGQRAQQRSDQSGPERARHGPLEHGAAAGLGSDGTGCHRLSWAALGVWPVPTELQPTLLRVDAGPRLAILLIVQEASTSAGRAFRALADETRRAILRMLRDGPRTSGAVAERFDSSWSTISRHLAVLRDADLVAAERHGQEIQYELNTSVFQDLAQHLLEWTTPAGGARRRHAKTRTRHQEA